MTDQRSQRGRLKLFLGYADGVGKTHAMLEAARQRVAEGVDVVAVCVTTYDQPETDGLIRGIGLIPQINSPDGRLDTGDIDLDAALDRKPDIVLVDDLAHTNSPQARHPKRFQDVNELLDGGVNVYATLNIQHLESLRDVVQQITGVQVNETIPDSVFDEAGTIELCDLPPDELLQRFREGRVHLASTDLEGAGKFYRLGNLIALRELSMRRAAGRIESQMRDYMLDRAIPGPWPAAESLMVCISSHPLGERLVRAGHRLALALNAGWYVIYVETPERLRFSEQHSVLVSRTLRLAEDLGAKVMNISGRTIPETIMEFSHRNNITKIMLGKPSRSRWSELLSGSLVDKIIRLSGDIDVYVVSDEQGPYRQRLAESWRPHGRWIRYLYGALLTAAATLVCVPLAGRFHPANLVMPYLAAVVISAAFFGRGPSMLTSFLSVLSFDFFFVHPRFSLDVTDTQYLLTFVGLLAVGLVISNLSGLVRDQVEALRQREQQAETLYNLSRELTVQVELPSILDTVIQQIAMTFSRASAILLPENGRLEIRAASEGISLDESEMAAASWTFEHGQSSGRGTEAFLQAKMRWQPLRTPRGITGALGVKPASDPGSFLSPAQRQFLDAYASLASLAIERVSLADQANRAQVMTASERLQTALLNSISHDLRTPLATITGVFSSLHEADQPEGSQIVLSKSEQLDLVDTGWEEARRLNRLVGNLLDMTRLESGALKIRETLGDIQDVIGSALAALEDALKGRPLQTNLQDGLPLVPMDFVLIEQVVVNLLDNSLKYSLPGTPIEISAVLDGDRVIVSVSDRGMGIPREDLEKVFEKFHRVASNKRVKGTGLGLSICKGIVEAHGGSIKAENREGGGARVCFELPIEREMA